MKNLLPKLRYRFRVPLPNILGLMLLFNIISYNAYSQIYNATSSESCIAVAGGDVTLTFLNPPPASSAVTLTFYYRGDLDGGAENFHFFDENSNLLGTSNFVTPQCSAIKDSIKVTVPATTFNSWLGNGSVDILADADPTVSNSLGACSSFGGSCAQAKMEYTSTIGNCANAFSNFIIDSISGNGVKINWTPGVGNTSFFMEYGVTGFTPGSTGGTIVTGTYPGAPNPPLIVSGLSPQTTYDIYFGEICNAGVDSVYFAGALNFNTTKTCAPVLNFASANITSSSADLSWTNTSAAPNFDIIYGAPGFDAAIAGTKLTVGPSPYTLSSLSSITDFEIYIIANCGAGGYSDTTGPISIQTLCGTYTAPYFNDFETDALDVPPVCWNEYSTASSAIVEVEDFTGTAAPYAGSRALYLNSGNSSTTPGADTLIAISPQFTDLPVGDKQIRFYANSDAPADSLIIGTIPNLVLGAAFTPIDTIYFPVADTYQEVILTLTTANGYNGTDEYIVFMHNLGVTTDYIRIDNFHYEVIPSCSKVSNISLTSIGVTSAGFTFSSTGNSFDVEFGPTGFQQGTGCTGNFSSNNILVDNTTDVGCPVQLGSNTTYDIYIRNNCTAGSNGVSIWEGPFTFTTLCAPFTAPYFNDFESEALDIPPVCWADYVTASTAFVEVEDFTGAAAPYAGSQALYLFSGNSSTTAGNDTLIAITPRFSDLSVGDKRVRFFANSDAPADRLIVGTIPNILPGAAFTPMDTIVFPTADTYQRVIVDFTTANGYNGTDEYIVLAHDLGVTTDYIRIDDFHYEEIPACQPSFLIDLGVTAIQATTADVHWGLSQGNKTYAELGIPGFTPGTGTQVALDSALGTKDTISFTGLTSQTVYEFYVQDSCAPGGLSVWVGPFSFTTKCVLTPMTLPFLEDFEAYVGPISTDGEFFCGSDFAWSVERPGNIGDILFSYTAASGPSTPFAGSQSAGLQSVLSANPIYLILTAELSNYAASGSDLELSFNWADYGDESSAGDRAWVRGNENDAWIEILNWTTPNSNNWQFFSIKLRGILASNGQNFSNTTQIRWGQQDDAVITGNDGFGLDDVRITEITCPDPAAVLATNVIDTAAALQWTGTTNATNYQVWYGPQGFYQGTLTVGGTQVLSPTDSMYITSFVEQTCYEYVVRAICSAGDTSNWVGPVVFCTGCTNQLSGVYTVGGPVGPTNFPTLDSVAAALNACGVSGPTTLNIAPGIYNENIRLDVITGSSAINTVTFNGGDTSLVEITHTSTSDEPTIHFDGADYVTFKNVTVSNLSTSDAWGFMFQNGSDFNTIDSCRVYVPVTTTTDIIPIVASNTLTAETSTGNNTNHLTISNCFISGGESGIHLEGGSTAAAYNDGNQILNNTLLYHDDHGIEVDGQINLVVNGNYVDSLSNTGADGISLANVNDFEVRANRVFSRDWGIYITDGNDGHTVTTNSMVVNNMVVCTTGDGIYLNDFENTEVYHNSVVGTPALLINDQSNTVIIKNNIFYSSNGYALESTDALNVSDVIDYNLFFSGGTNYFEILNAVYANLAAWQVATPALNAQSLEGDPVFIDPNADLHVLSNLPNNSADPAVGILIDIDGDVRSATTPDMGADEFIPVAGDLALIKGSFIKGLCLTANDSVEIQVQNLIGLAVDFSVDPLTVTYDVTGQISTSGVVVINTGTLASGDTLHVYGTGIDLSSPGNYVLDAYIDPNAINTLAFNDTLNPSVDLDVDSNFVTAPKSLTLTSAKDSAEICVESSFFSGGSAFFITEQCQYKFSTGEPSGGWPAYLIADDYIEITGVPNSDLEGITLEQWTATALTSTYTFPAGTVLSPNGTAIIAVGQLTGSVPSPSDFYYHGNGTYTGNWSSTTLSGRILKDANGNIIDAVINNAFTWPAASGVTATDWSGAVPTTGNSSGNRLEGPDLNGSAGWIASATSAQDPNAVNAGVTVPIAQSNTGFTWTLNGVVVDTLACTYAGPHTVGGTYTYIASFTNACGTFTDSVVVTVPNCFSPTTLAGGSTSASSVYLTWDTTALGSATYEVSYGLAGFTAGSGLSSTTGATDSIEITGIPNNLCYEYYIRAVCGPSDFSPWIGPISVCPDEEICTDDLEQYAIGLIEGQSALFLPWEGLVGAAGTASISTVQASSGTQSLRLSNPTGNAADNDDVITYFDTINTGAWSIAFDLYVPTGNNAYFNIQQNHNLGGTGHDFSGEIYFQGNGTAQVQHSANVVVGTFSYNQGSWNAVNVIIDLPQDSIWFELNGSSTGIGFAYSVSNGVPLQFNGVNFFTGRLAADATFSEFYVDNFCASPYVPAVCFAPSALTVSNEGCDSVEVSWTSQSGNQSSIIEYGTTGFAKGSGTYISFVNSPTVINGLTPGTTYEFYVADTCGTLDTSAYTGPVSFTTLAGPLPVASFTNTLNGFNVTFDASASTNATSYSWDFGDGNSGSGVNPTHTYATGGSFSVILTATNSCGTDDTIIVLANISLAENVLSRSMLVYPNPSVGEVNISLETFGSEDVVIRVLDLSGKQIMQMTDLNANGKMDYKLDINELAAGVYMLEVSSGSLKANRRLVKQ